MPRNYFKNKIKQKIIIQKLNLHFLTTFKKFQYQEINIISKFKNFFSILVGYNLLFIVFIKRIN